MKEENLANKRDQRKGKDNPEPEMKRSKEDAPGKKESVSPKEKDAPGKDDVPGKVSCSTSYGKPERSLLLLSP